MNCYLLIIFDRGNNIGGEALTRELTGLPLLGRRIDVADKPWELLVELGCNLGEGHVPIEVVVNPLPFHGIFLRSPQRDLNPDVGELVTDICCVGRAGLALSSNAVIQPSQGLQRIHTLTRADDHGAEETDAAREVKVEVLVQSRLESPRVAMVWADISALVSFTGKDYIGWEFP